MYDAIGRKVQHEITINGNTCRICPPHREIQLAPYHSKTTSCPIMWPKYIFLKAVAGSRKQKTPSFDGLLFVHTQINANCPFLCQPCFRQSYFRHLVTLRNWLALMISPLHCLGCSGNENFQLYVNCD